MNTPEIRTLLHEEIEHGDDRLLKMIYAIVKEYNEADDVASKRKQLIEEERSKYLKGEGRSYSWQEVKNMAIHKDRPNEL
ncbi:hypothetical protein GCM10023093_11920 [Nemorincola caseinilytica]|uniref:Addiction module component, TIGR02574 family n=1 Tax=Nemorincola caseinilytica TaxID=2054315 RepID=A0ABP8NDE3_9BACT